MRKYSTGNAYTCTYKTDRVKPKGSQKQRNKALTLAHAQTVLYTSN